MLSSRSSHGFLTAIKKHKNRTELQDSSNQNLAEYKNQDRVFDGFPVYVSLSHQTRRLEILNTIQNEASIQRFTVPLSSHLSIESHVKAILEDACRELLDDYGRIRSEVIILLNWDQNPKCFDPKAIQGIVNAYLITATRQISESLSKKMEDNNQLMHADLAVSSFIKLNQVTLTAEVFNRTQQTDNRTPIQLLSALRDDFRSLAPRSCLSFFSCGETLQQKVEKLFSDAIKAAPTDFATALQQFEIACRKQDLENNIIMRIINCYGKQFNVPLIIQREHEETKSHQLGDILLTGSTRSDDATLPVSFVR